MCRFKIHKNHPTILCTICKEWIHKRCVTIPWDRAEKNKNVFKCKNCEEKETPDVTEPIETIQVDDVVVDENFAKHPEANEGKSNEGDCRANKNKDKSSSGSVANNAPNTGDKNVNAGDTDSGKNGGMPGVPVTQSASQGIDTLRLNLDALKPTSWLQDSHIKIAIEDIEWQYRNQCGSTLYFVPSLSHFIKLASQGDVDAQLKQSDAISKRHILFIVNDCNGELGSGEGSHFSLLVYERDGNTWYHVDSGGKANAPHAKQIMNKVNQYLVNQGSRVNSNTSYVESRCTQQRNGYDCGPLAILFAKTTTKKIARGESLHTCLVDENETKNVRRRIHTQLSNKLQYLKKSGVRTNYTMNHSDKDEMVKGKVCWFYKYTECKSGKNCSYWHPPGVRQKERDRYSDGLFDSRDYGRSVNGRQNSKQIPHDPHNTDKYKYQNMYSYGINRDHANSHQGSRSQKYPQKSYSNEKQNQSTHFLGYRRNPNYGSTKAELRPTPAELFKILKNYFLQEGPTRR